MNSKPTYEELEQKIKRLEQESAKSKGVEEALRENEERFRLTFQTSPDSININRLEDGMYIDINEGFTRLTGFTREDVIGKTSLSLDIWHDPDDRHALVRALKDKGYCSGLEARFRRKDGSVGYGLMSARVLTLKGVPHIISVTRDISDSKRAEEELRRERENLAAILENNPNGIMVIDGTGKFLYVNPEFTKITGYTLHDVPSGREWFRNVYPDPEYRKTVIDAWNQDCSQEGGNVDREFRIICKGGQVKNILFRTTFMKTQAIQVLIYVTHRRQASEALRESEARFREMADLLPQVIYEADAEGSLTYANSYAFDLFGYTRDDLPVLRAEDFYASPSDRGDFTRRMAEAGFVQDVVRYKRKDGTEFDCQRMQVALKDKSGQVVAFQGINRDVSHLRRAEEALRESEQRFRSLFDQSLDAIYVAAPDGSSLAANQAWLDLFGYTREELPQIGVLSIYADPAGREDFLRRIGETGFVKDEVRFKRKDGTVFDAERTVVALKDPSGNVLAYQGVNRDITERKRAEQALRTSEERLAQLARHGRVVAWEVDTDGLFTYVSPVATEVLGFRPEELVGKRHFYDVPVDTAREEVKTLGLAAIHNGKEVTDVDCPLMTADARVLWSVISGVPLTDADGKTIGLRGWMVDNSARKQAEMALRESEQKYRELFRHSMDAISLVSPGGLLLEANQAYLDLFGCTKEDIGVLNVEEHYIDPEDRTRLLEAIAERGELVDDEVRLRRRNGFVMDCVRTVVVRRDPHGDVIGDQSVIRDVTEAKQAERNLRESEQQYRQLFEQSMDAIYLGTPQGRIIDVNLSLIHI